VIPDESILDKEVILGESILDESILDESILDKEGILGESILDKEVSLDESILDEGMVLDTGAILDKEVILDKVAILDEKLPDRTTRTDSGKDRAGCSGRRRRFLRDRETRFPEPAGTEPARLIRTVARQDAEPAANKLAPCTEGIRIVQGTTDWEGRSGATDGERSPRTNLESIS
jgi:hypothetical protein